MDMKYFVVDTYAWIEYFKGSEQGLKLFSLVKNTKNELFTPVTAITELKDYCDANSRDFEALLSEIRSNSHIVLLDENDAIEAGRNHAEMKKKTKNWGYVDSFIVAVHKKIERVYGKTRIVTGDKHFKELNCTYWIK